MIRVERLGYKKVLRQSEVDCNYRRTLLSGDALALLSGHDGATAAGDGLTVLTLDLSRDGSADTFGDILTLPPGHSGALLAGDLPGDLLALLPGHVVALLPRDLPALLPGLLPALLPGHLSARRGGGLAVVTPSRGWRSVAAGGSPGSSTVAGLGGLTHLLVHCLTDLLLHGVTHLLWGERRESLLG